MWQAAAAKLNRSVHAVLRKQKIGNNVIWHTIGTAFLIRTEIVPLLITNTHVVADKDLNIYDDLALSVMAYPYAGTAGLRVEELIPELDIALLIASHEAGQGDPVEFAKPELLPIGTPVAGLGFPLPDQPTINGKKGELLISRRLATGFISNPDRMQYFLDFPKTPRTLEHYEINMFAYPGISGGPLFDMEGKIVGVCRGISNFNQQFTGYSYAIRNKEILEYLEKNNVAYHKP